MKRTDLTQRITQPKYKVGQFVLNEYEVRELLARVAEGTLDPKGIIIKDSIGVKSTIDSRGVTSNNLYGFDLAYKLTIRKLK